MTWDDPAQALRFVREVRQAVEDWPDIPDDAVDDFTDAGQHTNELEAVATTPVTIGVVGEFTAGKSSVVGAILGKPDLLPVARRAATAQVTALRLRPGPDGVPTALGPDATVELLGPAELAACLTYMAEKLADDLKRSKPAVDRRPLQEFLAAFAGSGTPASAHPSELPAWRDPRTWQRFDAWARGALWAGPEDNEQIRGRVRELHALSEAVLSAEPSLFGTTHTLPAQEALKLADTGRPETPGAPYPGRSPARERLDAAVLTRLLRPDPEGRQEADRRRLVPPLIRRINLDVAVRPGTWAPVESGDGGAVLLDFPGLGAAGRRDDYLCQSQLKNVETILVVARGDLMGSDLAASFYGMMETQRPDRAALRDSILVAFNKWDCADVPQLPDGVAATGETVTEHSDDLYSLRTDAAKLLFQRRDRMQPFSVFTALTTEGTGLDCTLRDLASPSEEEIAALGRKRLAWGRLAGRIAAADPGHHWVDQLGEYARDGGLLALRGLLARHIEEHGARLKRQTIKEQFLRTHRAWRTVDVRAGARGVAAGSPEHARIIQRFEQLRTAAERLMTGLHELRNPAKARRDGGASVLARLEERAVAQVFTWPLWGELYATLQDGVVAKAPRTDPEDVPEWVYALPEEERHEFLDNLRGRTRERQADTTAAFHEQYEKTVRSLYDDAFEQLTLWAAAWAAEQDEAFGESVAWLAEEETAVRLESLFAELPDRATTPSFRVTQLKVLARTSALASAAERGARKRAEARTEAPVGGFPQLQDHVLPWSHEYRDDPSPERRNAESSQYAVALFRDRLVASVYEQTAAAFADMLAAALAQMIGMVQENAKAVPDSLQVAQMISAAARGGGAKDEEQEHGARQSLRAVLRRWEAEK
ncbi:dynamin family protein [Streptomyces sp. NPDC088733]|uniref:dynamin family protein n=1 Tax=Streptomyces sp. NPDC088733 TaxID=3365880 RepID=UPI003812EE72